MPSANQFAVGLAPVDVVAALGHGYPVAGGLSQSAVNDKAGARTPLALVFASIALAACLLFLTGFLEELPKAVLAAVVLTAIYGLLDFPALLRMWRISRLDFYAATIALGSVLLLGILRWLGHQSIEPVGRHGHDHHEDNQEHQQYIDQRSYVDVGGESATTHRECHIRPSFPCGLALTPGQILVFVFRF